MDFNKKLISICIDCDNLINEYRVIPEDKFNVFMKEVYDYTSTMDSMFETNFTHICKTMATIEACHVTAMKNIIVLLHSIDLIKK